MPIIKKDIIHIIAEIIIIFSITYYFYSMNKKVVVRINVLEKQIESQNTIIQNHETIINSHFQILT